MTANVHKREQHWLNKKKEFVTANVHKERIALT